MTKDLTIREIIKILKEEGHMVEFYERKDGGILIKSIDGVKYQGAPGTKVGRWMTGQSISEKRATQLQKITTTGKRAKKTITDNEVKKALQKAQKVWNKAFPHKRGEKPDVGLKTAKQVKWNLEHKGKEETLRLLKESERYARGLAYHEGIKDFIEQLQEYNKKKNNSSINQLISDIIIKQDSIRWEWLSEAYQTAYKFNDKNYTIEEVVRQIRINLHLDEK